MLNIIADKEIPLVEEAFSTIGNITLLDSDEISQKNLLDTDILLVRSITKVDADLLAGTPVRCIASATAGIDHIDQLYLSTAGIHLVHAPGANAEGVVQYVLMALFTIASNMNFKLSGKKVGIIGYGNIGSRLGSVLSALHIDYMIYDPPLQRAGYKANFVTLNQLQQADIITLHVPLTRSGTDPTWHMVDASFLTKLKSGAVLINTARGAVLDSSALLQALKNDELITVLDVWEEEPNINISLLNKVTLATPHIAGYTLRSKVRGIESIYVKVCEYLGLEKKWKYTVSNKNEINTIDSTLSGLTACQMAITNISSIESSDEQLRVLENLSGNHIAAEFSLQRKQYKLRNEFSDYHCQYDGDDKTKKMLKALKFTLDY